MKSSDSICSGGWGGEDELHLQDVVFAQWNDEEHAIEGTCTSQSYQSTDIFFGEVGHEAQAIHCRNGADENDTNATRGGGSSLGGRG